MKNISSIAFALILLYSCHDKNAESSYNLSDVSSYFLNEADTLTYEMREERYTYPMQKGMIDTTYVNFVYPVYAGNRGDVDSFMNRSVADLLSRRPLSDDTTSSSKKKMANDFFAEYEEYLREKPEYIMPYAMSVGIQPMHRLGSIVSIASFGFLDLGGAHPSHSILYQNYHIDRKTKIDSKELIDLQGKELLAIGEKYFKIQNNVPEDSSVGSMTYFWEQADGHPEGVFYLNGNYAFEKDSIVWLYNSGEIGGYAMGNPTVKLPKSAILNYLRR
jgi:hypothetical protein